MYIHVCHISSSLSFPKLYHGVWEIAMAIFVIQSVIYAHNMRLDSLTIFTVLLLDNHDIKHNLIAYLCVTMI